MNVIVRVAVTRTPFLPRYAVEFSGIAMGTRRAERRELARIRVSNGWVEDRLRRPPCLPANNRRA
jgi:hypothetical protein